MPRSSKKRFTEQMLQKLRSPAAGRLEIADELAPGLVLRVTERGVRTFAVIYRVPGEGGVSPMGRALAGKQHRITIGHWPAVALPEARDRAREIMASARKGRDPKRAATAEIINRRENTFAATLQRHIKQDASRNIASWRNVERVLTLHAIPKLGYVPTADVRRADVHSLLDDLVAAGKIGTAREVRKHLSKLFNWAVDRELITSNPIYSLKRADLAPREEAGRALTDLELKAIWLAAEELRYPFGMLFQLVILTGQRRAEWGEAKRSELNEEMTALELGRERFKGRRAHIVPLAGPAAEIVSRLPAWAGVQDYYLFSSRAGRVPTSGYSQGKARLDELATTQLRLLTGDKSAAFRRYRIHDFRVTCETRLAHLAVVTAHGSLGDSSQFQRVRDEGDLVVSAADIASKLRNVRVVILFVCSAGRADQVPGAATTFGLAKKVLERGGSAVVASAWPLDSRVTHHWLPTFLDEWTTGRRLDEAVFAANQAVGNGLGYAPETSLALSLYGDPSLVFSGVTSTPKRIVG